MSSYEWAYLASCVVVWLVVMAVLGRRGALSSEFEAEHAMYTFFAMMAAASWPLVLVFAVVAWALHTVAKAFGRLAP